MKHFLEISQLSKEEINSLLNRALYFKKSKEFPHYPMHTVATLFYENSTRTRLSFELAAKKLGMTTLNFDVQHSSEAKGEEIEDTLQTLAAMGIDLFVLRHRQDGLPAELAANLKDSTHIINAGDGQHAHPSQAMLDLLTIKEKKPQFNELKIAIIGNIRHSRVANSLRRLFAEIQVKDLMLIAPEIWQPEELFFGRKTNSLREGLAEADVVICLRVQHERLMENEQFDLTLFRNNYALTKETIRFAKHDALIMHPGPINRGVEIDSEVADGPQSCILQQVNNGVYMRMAILESLVR